MRRYIDADKLIAEIFNLEPFSCISEVQDGFYSAINRINDIIDSLQQEQPEVDLGQFDKDVTKIWGRCAAEPNDSIACLHIETFNEVARHFYELGINARKKV